MKNALKWILFLVALTPIVISNNVLFPYVTTKTLYLRALFFVLSAGFTYLLVSSKNFREEIGEKVRLLWQKPLTKAITASFVLLAITTAFAFDKNLAFFGTLERGEGFISFVVFYGIFFFTAILFDRIFWYRFFNLTLVSGWILFIVELSQYFKGIVRPGSWADNPIFLAAYYLFVIFAAIMIYVRGRENKSKTAVFLSLMTIGICLVGIFITESRGVLLAMGLAFLISLCYLVFARRTDEQQSKQKIDKQKQLPRKTLATILVVGVILVGAFIATRHQAFWQKVPGFNRLAALTSESQTVQSRLINTRITLHAANPGQVGIKNFLIGWGWDNYIFAWQKFYDPEIYVYDPGIFDRAHNKLLDVLIMTGILGLLSYLAIWFFFIREIILYGRNNRFGAAVFLFFAASFFLQNLSGLDTIVTYIPFFAILAYILYERDTITAKK